MSRPSRTTRKSEATDSSSAEASSPGKTYVHPLLVIVSGTDGERMQAVAHLQVARPALIPRLPSLPSVAPDAGRTIATLDCSPSHSLLGMPEYMNWKTTLETTIDALLEMEKAW
jgi:hypothetical protein